MSHPTGGIFGEFEPHPQSFNFQQQPTMLSEHKSKSKFRHGRLPSPQPSLIDEDSGTSQILSQAPLQPTITRSSMSVAKAASDKHARLHRLQARQSSSLLAEMTVPSTSKVYGDRRHHDKQDSLKVQLLEKEIQRLTVKIERMEKASTTKSIEWDKSVRLYRQHLQSLEEVVETIDYLQKAVFTPLEDVAGGGGMLAEDDEQEKDQEKYEEEEEAASSTTDEEDNTTHPSRSGEVLLSDDEDVGMNGLCVTPKHGNSQLKVIESSLSKLQTQFQKPGSCGSSVVNDTSNKPTLVSSESSSGNRDVVTASVRGPGGIYNHNKITRNTSTSRKDADAFGTLLQHIKKGYAKPTVIDSVAGNKNVTSIRKDGSAQITNPLETFFQGPSVHSSVEEDMEQITMDNVMKDFREYRARRDVMKIQDAVIAQAEKEGKPLDNMSPDATREPFSECEEDEEKEMEQGVSNTIMQGPSNNNKWAKQEETTKKPTAAGTKVLESARKPFRPTQFELGEPPARTGSMRQEATEPQAPEVETTTMVTKTTQYLVRTDSSIADDALKAAGTDEVFYGLPKDFNHGGTIGGEIVSSSRLLSRRQYKPQPSFGLWFRHLPQEIKLVDVVDILAGGPINRFSISIEDEGKGFRCSVMYIHPEHETAYLNAFYKSPLRLSRFPNHIVRVEAGKRPNPLTYGLYKRISEENATRCLKIWGIPGPHNTKWNIDYLKKWLVSECNRLVEAEPARFNLRKTAAETLYDKVWYADEGWNIRVRSIPWGVMIRITLLLIESDDWVQIPETDPGRLKVHYMRDSTDRPLHDVFAKN